MTARIVAIVLALAIIATGAHYLHRFYVRLIKAEAQTAVMEDRRATLQVHVDSVVHIAYLRDSIYANEIERVYLVLADLETRKADARLREMKSNEAIHEERRRFREAINHILNQ